MNKTIRMLSAVALAGGMSIALAGSGYAQDQTRPAAPAGAEQGHGWDPGAMRQRMEEHWQHRLQTLHDAIGLRADQEGAWQAFVAALRPPEGERREGWKGRRDGEEHAQLTTPERLDRMAERMAKRQARFQQQAAAIKAFYAALDPRQQKTFDALIGARFGGGMGMHGGMGGRGRDGRMGG